MRNVQHVVNVMKFVRKRLLKSSVQAINNLW